MRSSSFDVLIDGAAAGLLVQTVYDPLRTRAEPTLCASVRCDVAGACGISVKLRDGWHHLRGTNGPMTASEAADVSRARIWCSPTSGLRLKLNASPAPPAPSTPPAAA
jgi:hypothetical protein